MHHLHFNRLDSTQVYLRENLEQLKATEQEILISASHQNSGVGRNNNSWDFYQRSLAMSCTITPHKVPTLTPIEVALLVIDFFENEFQQTIKIKWPNDLMTVSQFKCGGILTQYIDNKMVIAGIGLNIGDSSNAPTSAENYKHGLGFVSDSKLNTIEQKSLAAKLYQFMLHRRITDPVELKKRFEKSCAHLGGRVEVDDDQKFVSGIFQTIGEHGEALIKTDDGIHSFLSSSLKILD